MPPALAAVPPPFQQATAQRRLPGHVLTDRSNAPVTFPFRSSPMLPRLLTVYQLTSLSPTCYDQPVDNRTEPRTARQWIRYLVVGVIALFLVWWMLRVYVL